MNSSTYLPVLLEINSSPVSKEDIVIREPFLGYIEIHAKDAATLKTVITEKLESDNLPLAGCRSQCYDNAAVMTGHISGLQQQICDRNPRALFVNCDNHSLNLVGVHAAKVDPIVITFFGTVESTFLFFSHSTLRWEQLKNAVKITVKRKAETRWNTKAEAVKAISEGITEQVELLESLSDNISQTMDTRNEAGTLFQNILKFNFIVLLHFWNNILGKVDPGHKRLQDPTINFKDAAFNMEMLKNYLKEFRDHLCQNAIKYSKRRCIEWGIEVERKFR
ncbi:52 kDa repressor of the inhibitor of the protein kinase-like [Hydra vulgaris]|uniref:52 kDa repressor of the inhibitor of the protein kinase-like n=1 Tax=Hydra vulgaris TaxID=6087 RepID=A0ABM4CRY0_HYDVU